MQITAVFTVDLHFKLYCLVIFWFLIPLRELICHGSGTSCCRCLHCRKTLRHYEQYVFPQHCQVYISTALIRFLFHLRFYRSRNMSSQCWRPSHIANRKEQPRLLLSAKLGSIPRARCHTRSVFQKLPICIQIFAIHIVEQHIR